jgi:hypothetical protein
MRLIYGNQRNIHLCYARPEHLRLQAFGRYIQKPDVSIQAVVQVKVNFPAAHPRMDGNGLDPPFLQLSYLIVHQRNQGRNHNAKAVRKQCRHLETNRLAAPCGEKGKGVLPRKDGLDNFLLHGPELTMPPVPLQYRQGCFHQIEYKGICRQQIMPAGMMELEKRLRTAMTIHPCFTSEARHL